jgi:hypothetical protein
MMKMDVKRMLMVMMMILIMMLMIKICYYTDDENNTVTKPLALVIVKVMEAAMTFMTLKLTDDTILAMSRE